MIIHLLAYAPSPSPGAATPSQVPAWLLPVILGALIGAGIIVMVRSGTANRNGRNQW